jgi:protoheme IX farnesyltransferase
VQANPLTAALGASNILLYAGIYTPLKQLSPVNTWVGAVVGAIPPLMGWASASGGTLEPGAAVLAGALFSWQMPHFMALAWMCKEDYMRGGFRMLSATDATGRRTALVALRHSLLLLPLGFLAVAAGAATEPFAWEAAALGTLLTVSSLRFVASPSTQNARSMFKSSLLYLPLLLVGAAVHRLPNNHSLTWEVLQSRLEAALSGAPSDGFLPLMRSAAERSAPAVQRLFGLGQAAISELRCPSTVYSDAGEDVVIIPQQNADGSTTLVVESVKAAKHRVALSVQQATSSSSSTSTSSSSVAEVSQDSSSSSSSLPSQHLQEKEQQGEPQPSSAGASTLAVKWKWAASRDRP